MGKCMVQPAGAAAEVISTLREVRQGGASFAETGASHHGSLNSSSSPTRLAHLVEFTSCEALEPNNPELATLAAFFRGLSESGRSATACVSSMRLVAAILGLEGLQVMLKSSVVLAWAQAGRVHAPAKEAVPLPLYVVANWERAIVAGMKRGGCADTLLLTAFLVMLWSALRFSDAQRVLVKDTCVKDGVLRGQCWRTKTSKSGMPFGCLCLGIYEDWGHAVDFLLQYMQHGDFLMPGPSGSRGSYTFVLGQLRRLLVQVGGIPPDVVVVVVADFTLHSLKATPLSWAVQLEIRSEARRIWGHHRARCPGEAMVEKYSRDDVIQALRAQLTTLTCVKQRWRPLAAQGRGGRHPVAELPLAAKPSGLQETVPGLRPFRAARASHDDLTTSLRGLPAPPVAAMVAPAPTRRQREKRQLLTQTLFLLNNLSLCFHAAVLLEDGSYGRACAPRRALTEPNWQVLTEHPLDGRANRVPCSHISCSPALATL